MSYVLLGYGLTFVTVGLYSLRVVWRERQLLRERSAGDTTP